MPSPQVLEREHYIERLNENGFVTVKFGLNGADIDPLFAHFNEFVDLCNTDPRGEEFRDAMTLLVRGREEEGDYWLLSERVGVPNPHIGGDPTTEDKDTAHVGPKSVAQAEATLGRKMPGVMREFLKGCIEVHEATKKAVRPVFDALGVTEPLLAKDGMEDIHVVRVLRYLGTQATHQAEPHFDRSKFTAAVWESHPGLFGAPGNNGISYPVSVAELEEASAQAHNSPITHHSGWAKVFAGAGFNHFQRDVAPEVPRLPLLLHGVTNERPGEERNAIVVFMHQREGVVCAPVYRLGGETGFDSVRKRLARYDPLAGAA